MALFYPLSFLPQFQYRLWGGEKLSTVLKKPYEGEKKGESWEISAVPGFDSEVANGILKGKSLTELIDAFPKEIMGPSVLEKFGKTFPLLFKLLMLKFLFRFRFIPMMHSRKSVTIPMEKMRCGMF